MATKMPLIWILESVSILRFCWAKYRKYRKSVIGISENRKVKGILLTFKTLKFCAKITFLSNFTFAKKKVVHIQQRGFKYSAVVVLVSTQKFRNLSRSEAFQAYIIHNHTAGWDTIFSHIYLLERYIIEILEIMPQMWQYVIFLCLKPTKVTSDFILH